MNPYTECFDIRLYDDVDFAELCVGSKVVEKCRLAGSKVEQRSRSTLNFSFRSHLDESGKMLKD